MDQLHPYYPWLQYPLVLLVLSFQSDLSHRLDLWHLWHLWVLWVLWVLWFPWVR